MKYAVIPAGGLGTRMGNIEHSKELLLAAGQPVIEQILNRLISISPERIFVTLAPDKQDLISYLTNDSPHRNLISLIVGPRKGLLDGIISPSSRLQPNDKLYFGLPDTIWYPTTAYQDLVDIDSPLVLGVLPSETPQFYGSVVLRDSGEIEEIIEKPANPISSWIWAFGKLQVSTASQLDSSLVFTEALGKFAKHNQAKAVPFPDGAYLDIGTPESYSQAELFIKSHAE